MIPVGPACDVGSTVRLAASYDDAVRGCGGLVVQGCVTCAAAAFPPRLRCSTCGSSALQWWPAGRTGTLAASVPVVADNPRQRPPGLFRQRLPYATGIVVPDDWPTVRLAVAMFGSDAGGEAGHRLGRVTIGIDTDAGRWIPCAHRVHRSGDHTP